MTTTSRSRRAAAAVTLIFGVVAGVVAVLACAAEEPADESTEVATAPRAPMQYRMVVAEGTPDAERFTFEGETVWLAADVIVDETDLVRAAPTLGYDDEPALSIEISAEAGERLMEITSDHIGERMAIVVDGEILTVVMIQSAVGELALVQGQFSHDEVQRLAESLNP